MSLILVQLHHGLLHHKYVIDYMVYHLLEGDSYLTIRPSWMTEWLGIELTTQPTSQVGGSLHYAVRWRLDTYNSCLVTVNDTINCQGVLTLLASIRYIHTGNANFQAWNGWTSCPSQSNSSDLLPEFQHNSWCIITYSWCILTSKHLRLYMNCTLCFLNCYIDYLFEVTPRFQDILQVIDMYCTILCFTNQD
jgi:hypothetical protein